MSHPTCCCASLDRCNRCDLLVDLEGFHLVAVARRACGLVLDIESCDRCADCPGCGLNRTRPRARGGGGDRRALGPGSRQGSGGLSADGYAANTPARRWHSWNMTSGCAPPRARLGTRAIRWAIRQLRFEGATIAGLVRQLATTWHTVWSHIKPCPQAASDDPARFAGVRVFGPPSWGSASKDTALCAADLHVCHLG